MGALPLVEALRRQAAAGLPGDVADYVEAGAGGEVSVSEAVATWDRLRFRPRVLRDTSAVDTSVTLFGTSLASPILVAPTGYHRLVHPDGEVEMARGVGAAGSLLVASTRSTMRLEDAAAAGGPWWFQVYVMRERELTAALVERAAAAGATALVLTGDTPYLGRKPRAPRIPLAGDEHLVNVAEHLAPGTDAALATAQDPTVTLEAVAWLRELSGLPVLVKGVLRGDDALACLDAGAAGLVVSNHGGRQLDPVVATAVALPEVVAAVDGRVPVLVDGGLRDGPSILAALALGAHAVLVGRPALWALAAGGAPAVDRLLTALADDLRHVLALAGATSVADLDPTLLAG